MALPKISQSKKPIKKVKKKPTTQVHICNQEATIMRQGELLERLGLVTLGNGTPENGLLFMFREFLEVDKRRKEDITDIKDSLKEVNANHNVLLGEITRVGSDLVAFKAAINGNKEGKKDAEERHNVAENLELTKARDNKYVVFSVIVSCITMAGVIAAIVFGIRNTKNTNAIINNEKVRTEITK